jgi:ubiquinone/menaquinone biosynthesis C-methylase UbiE
MKIGELDTDSKALKNRIESYRLYGSFDLNEWLFDKINIEKNFSVLDLGCGTGKQSIPMARMVGRGGSVFSLDVSKESINDLKASAKKGGVSDTITAINNSFDYVKELKKHKEMDVVISVYALYYADHIEDIIKNIRDIVSINGIFFACGPAKNNNFFIKNFISQIINTGDNTSTPASVFMEEILPPLVSKYFQSFKILTFENHLKFDSAISLYEYWKSHNMYDPSIDKDFYANAVSYFKNNPVFENVKNGVGIWAQGKR